VDGEQVKPRNSIQRELSRSILLTSLVLVLIAGLISSTLAFFEARDLQDSMLREIAHLLKRDRLSNIAPPAIRESEEETIIIQVLNGQPVNRILQIPNDIADGLQTIQLDGEKWRVLILTKPVSGQRIAVAQQTELRDNIAWASSLYVMLPIVLLVIVMLLLIHFIIRNQLQPLKALKDRLDGQAVTQLTALPDTDIPEEIVPFVSSINTLLARTRQAIKKQHRFIADAAHELRTPITALSLLAENVERAGSENERRERQGKLKQGLDRISALIIQLLDLARLQSDASGPTTALSFNTIVHNTIAELHPLAEAKQVDLGMARQEPVTVLDQDGRLGQLVRNAIDNAIRYSPPCSRVDVSLYIDAGNAVFCVEDTGAGIPEDELEQVMEPFYRNPGTSQPGNGLGLAICQEIAQLLGGDIALSNRVQGGLRFLYTQRSVSAQASNT
jgi:signal transduction histidine kinase